MLLIRLYIFNKKFKKIFCLEAVRLINIYTNIYLYIYSISVVYLAIEIAIITCSAKPKILFIL